MNLQRETPDKIAALRAERDRLLTEHVHLWKLLRLAEIRLSAFVQKPDRELMAEIRAALYGKD